MRRTAGKHSIGAGMRPAAAPPRGAVAVLLACAGATAVLPHVPLLRWLAWPLMLVSTFAHEMGHGIAALCVGGSFGEFRMWPDGSGVASVAAGTGRLTAALVSAGGLIGPAMAAAGLFGLARGERRARVALVGLVAGLLVVLALFVRGWFGLLFALTMAAVLALLARFGSAWLARLGLVFVAVQLALSVFTRADYLFTPVAHTSAGELPSDVAQIARALLLPYWFWGALIGALSVAVLLVGLWLYLRPQGRGARR
ncbi:MAG: M50 family metallopeptidase [Deltaproteobacteria bacterium]|nr:M50 family metallopeptidase [Deltaproteobacteria bacterium]